MQVLPEVEKVLVRELQYLNIKILIKISDYYLQAGSILFKFKQKFSVHISLTSGPIHSKYTHRGLTDIFMLVTGTYLFWWFMSLPW